MTDREKFDLLWVLCSETVKRRFLEILKIVESRNEKNREQKN